MLMNLDLESLHPVPLPGQKEDTDLTETDLAKLV